MNAAPARAAFALSECKAAIAPAVVAASCATVPIAAIAYALDCALHGVTSPRALEAIALALVAATGLQLAAALAAARIVRKRLATRALDLRVAAMAGLHRLSAAHLAAADAGRAVALLTSGIDDAVDAFAGAFDALFAGILTALASACLLLAVDRRIGLVALVLLPVVLGYLRGSRGISARATPRLGRARSEGATRFFEYVDSVALLRAFGATVERARRLARAIRELQVKTFETGVAPITFGVISLFFIEFGFGITVMVAATIGAHGALDGIAFVLALLIALFFFQTLFDAVDGYARLRDAAAAVSELDPLFDRAAAAPEPTAAVPIGASLAAEHLTFAYDRGPVISDVSWTFAERDVTAVVGASGAGKSALAGLLAGLAEPASGRVTIGGVDAARLAPAVRARAITLVFQDTTLPEESIRDAIAAGRPGASDAEIREAAEIAECDAFVRRFPAGYATRLAANGARLSAGERQRIAIARALLSEAPVVIFDECTASLDPASARAVHRAIEALAGRKTVIVITHRLGTIRSVRDILVMARGAVVEHGAHDDLLARDGEYARLWNAHERAAHWRPAGAA